MSSQQSLLSFPREALLRFTSSLVALVAATAETLLAVRRHGLLLLLLLVGLLVAVLLVVLMLGRLLLILLLVLLILTSMQEAQVTAPDESLSASTSHALYHLVELHCILTSRLPFIMPVERGAGRPFSGPDLASSCRSGELPSPGPSGSAENTCRGQVWEPYPLGSLQRVQQSLAVLGLRDGANVLLGQGTGYPGLGWPTRET